MNLNEVKQFIEQNKDNEEVKAYLQGFNRLTVEGVQKFVNENQDAKKWMDSEKDKHFNKGLETWLQKTFPSKLEEEIKKRYPDEDPKDKAYKEVLLKLEQMENEKKREALKNKALTIATEKKLPVSITDFFIGLDDDSTLSNLTRLEEVWNTYVQTAVDERLKSGSYTPPKDNNSYTGSNPWKKETFNLTQQAKILKENPELAKQLQAQAKN
jgi:hypothetical protein